MGTQAKWLLLGSLVKPPSFTQLRTEQQLGYIVWGGYDRRDQLAGLGLGIQSNGTERQELLRRINAFLAGFADSLDGMPDAEFETVKAGLIATLQEAPTDLGVTTVDRKAQLIALLTPLTRAEIATVAKAMPATFTRER